MKSLFTERHGGAKPRISEMLDDPCRAGLLGLIKARISEEWFGLAFPFPCQDGQVNAGSDKDKIKGRMSAYGVIWPEDWEQVEQNPTDGQVFDLIEFSFEHIAEPSAFWAHSYWNHSHYSYDQKVGRAKFEEEVNRMFERNGMAFELKQGEVTRMAPSGLQEALAQTVFQTGDMVLDGLLEDARHKFLNRDLKTRRESLEKLWDAWERLKTIEPGRDKKEQAKALLSRASAEPNLLGRLENEAIELTEIGNKFMIRHTETDKVPISESIHVDYLFQRMFAIIRLLLRGSSRGG
ncbi:MAG: AbiJ-NTD4 domain-containing protein [Acidobacteriaceae bacterium]